MSDLMSSVISQIRRAISGAINEQVLSQVQATLRSEQGQVPSRRWEVPSRRPECRSEEAINRRFRSSSRDEIPRNFNRNEDLITQQGITTFQKKLNLSNWLVP